MKTLAATTLLMAFAFLSAGCIMNDSSFTDSCLSHNAGIRGCKNTTAEYEPLQEESFTTNREYDEYVKLVLNDKELQDTIREYTKYCSATRGVTDLSQLNKDRIYTHMVYLNDQIKAGRHMNHELAVCSLMHSYTARYL